MAKQETVDFWRNQINHSQKYMNKRHKTWRRLLRKYDLEMEVPGVDDENVVKLSRFYPLQRQIIASIAFHYPRMFLNVEGAQYERASDILERSANQALRMMGAKEEVQQAIFWALFCGVAPVKVGYNPPGDDAVAPYVTNDGTDIEDFPYIRAVDPFSFFIDPLTPSHRLGHARFVMERMMVPLQFVRNDERYVNRRQITPSIQKADSDGFMANLGTPMSDEEREAFEQAQADGEMVCLWEIHDRVNKKLITFAEGVEQPIEEREHPFLRVEPITEMDPFTGEKLLVDTRPVGGYLTANGFPYSLLRFDTGASSIYPQPPMAYVEDLQQLQMESVTRRQDLLKRFRRIVLGTMAERQANPTIGDDIRTADDAEIVWANDPNGFKELTWGAAPNDQLSLESDARAYEEQMLHVSELTRSGGAKTATEASLIASAGGINREWMQSKIADLYAELTTNVLNIMGDMRYTPKNFIVNIAEEGEEEVLQTLQAAHFLVDFKINIQAGSMQPLVEQLERDDTLQMANFLRSSPNIDQVELDKAIMSAFRVPDPDKLLITKGDPEAVRAAQLENEGWLITGQDPGVQQGQDHETHIETHMARRDEMAQQVAQSQAAGIPPQPQMIQAIQAFDAHIQQHQQVLAGEAQAASGAPSVRAGGPSSILGQVQSNAQRTADAVTSEAQQQTEAARV